MNGGTRDTATPQVIGDLIAHSLGTTKDNGLRRGVGAVSNAGLLQDLHQDLILVVVGARLDDLGDVLVALKFVAVANLHLEGVSQELRGQSTDGGRPSGGEEHRVPLPWHLVQNLPDLWLETHVEHAVCLVKDELGNFAEAQLASLEEVVDAAGGAGDTMDACADVSQLLVLRCASVAACRPETAGTAKPLRFVLYLHSKFAGGRDDEDCRVPGWQAPLEDVSKGRKEERKGLPTARGCNADGVTLLQCQWPGVLLDLRRCRETCLRKLCLDACGEGRLIKSRKP
mmetsp:Transcript_173984/g.423228  ORF Transcript_173984/g.423228 Transcript_173984/m.423228 type:complete len:285 (+) Transcript_173984:872-1726(+)